MSAAKHTPGPWFTDNTNELAPGVCYINSQYNRSGVGDVATVYGADPANEEHIESVANARLIAAAPDLLEAAQKALAECVDLVETDAGRALEAAIAKATGEAA